MDDRKILKLMEQRGSFKNKDENEYNKIHSEIKKGQGTQKKNGIIIEEYANKLHNFNLHKKV